MANKDNQRKYYYPIRDAKNPYHVSLVEITEAQYRAVYPSIWATRKREQEHKRCMCPKRYFWKCDGHCDLCEYHKGYDVLSLDVPMTEDGNTLLDSKELAEPELMEEIISDRILLEQLFQRLRELDPDADKIIGYWLDDSSISDREIARRLGRKQRTFADQMKKIRTELRKVRGY